MNDKYGTNIPFDVISKGRDMGEVLDAYMEFYERAKAEAQRLGKPQDEIVADAMQGATYRLYLLGVEDGMK